MTGKKSKIRSQAGYLLLSVMLLITLMLIVMAVEAPRIAQQIQRGKEEELVHRGMEYAKAVKKYRRKMGAFPTSIEQLENTNHIRFLRKRYKDPITGKDNWKLIHFGEAEIPLPKGANPGLPGSGNPGLQGSTFTSGGGKGGPSGLGGGNPGGLGSQPPPKGGGGSLGSLKTDNIGGQKFGGGGIVGVASVSKKSGIKEFHDSSEYDEWLFVYDPRLEQASGQHPSATAGIIVAASRAGGGGSSDGESKSSPGQKK